MKADGYERVGVYGYCWGGKLVLLSSASPSPFDAGAVIHPAMIANEDAERLKVPFGFYPSKVSRVAEDANGQDEPKEVVAVFDEQLQKNAWKSLNGYHLFDTV